VDQSPFVRSIGLRALEGGDHIGMGNRWFHQRLIRGLSMPVSEPVPQRRW
jgi:hypothetical protein